MDQSFRMELDGEGMLIFIGLDDAVRSVGGNTDAGSRVFHGLMMGGIDGQGVLAEDLVEDTPLLNTDSVVKARVLDERVDLGRDVLIQCAAEHDVHQLFAAADCQDWLARRECRAGKQQVTAVTDRIDFYRPVPYLLPILGRIDIRTAGKDDAVHLGKQTLGQDLVVNDGKDDGNTSGAIPISGAA